MHARIATSCQGCAWCKRPCRAPTQRLAQHHSEVTVTIQSRMFHAKGGSDGNYYLNRRCDCMRIRALVPYNREPMVADPVTATVRNQVPRASL
jgi:hypothetical protein